LSHPQARTDNGFYTKIGFSKDDPSPEVPNRRMGTYVRRDARHFPLIFSCDALGLQKPVVDKACHPRARCVENDIHAELASRRRSPEDCGMSREVFNIDAAEVALVRERIFEKWSKLNAQKN
jgi:hypothetical protein